MPESKKTPPLPDRVCPVTGESFKGAGHLAPTLKRKLRLVQALARAVEAGPLEGQAAEDMAKSIQSWGGEPVGYAEQLKSVLRSLG